MRGGKYKVNAGLARCTDEERDYLCAFASEYFARPVTPADVVWTYSGVRPLYNDGAKSATAATRDYVLSVDDRGAPLLSVFGGKITTYRRLAEHAMEKIARFFPGLAGPWTAGVALPGGDFAVDGVKALIEETRRVYSSTTAGPGGWCGPTGPRPRRCWARRESRPISAAISAPR